MIEKGSEIGILSLQLIKKIHGSGRVGSGRVGWGFNTDKVIMRGGAKGQIFMAAYWEQHYIKRNGKLG